MDSSSAWRGLTLAAACLLAAGCGYVGDPLPPALHIPLPVQDLRVLEYGDRLLIEFTVPDKTTEGLAVTRLASAELRIGPGGSPFQAATWEAGATAFRVDVTEPGTVRHEIPVGAFAGKEVVVGVRSLNERGRTSEWSNLVSVRVVPPVAAPRDLKAAAVSAGVRLSWSSPEASFRILRKGPGEEKPAVVGQASKPEYEDATAQFGTAYEYAVQAIHGEAESEPAGPVSLTPQDTFPPAVPAGVNAVAGPGAIALAWDRNTEPDFATYRIYRSTDDGAWEVLAPSLNVPAYTDRKVEPGKRYRYAVSSLDQLGNESARSAPVEAVAP